MKFSKYDNCCQHNHIDYDIQRFYEEDKYLDTGHVHHTNYQNPCIDKLSHELDFLKKEVYDLHYIFTKNQEKQKHKDLHQDTDNAVLKKELDNISKKVKSLETSIKNLEKDRSEVSYELMTYIGQVKNDILNSIDDKLKNDKITNPSETNNQDNNAIDYSEIEKLFDQKINDKFKDLILFTDESKVSVIEVNKDLKPGQTPTYFYSFISNIEVKSNKEINSIEYFYCPITMEDYEDTKLRQCKKVISNMKLPSQYPYLDIVYKVVVDNIEYEHITKIFPNQLTADVNYIKLELIINNDIFEWKENIEHQYNTGHEFIDDLLKVIDYKCDITKQQILNVINDKFNNYYTIDQVNTLIDDAIQNNSHQETISTTLIPDSFYNHVYSIRELNDLHNYIHFSYDEQGNIHIKYDKEIFGFNKIFLSSGGISYQFIIISNHNNEYICKSAIDYSQEQLLNILEKITLEGHKGSVRTLLCLKDGRLLSASYDKTLCFWDTISFQQQTNHTIKRVELYSFTNCVKYFEGVNRLVVGGRGTFCIVDLNKYQIIKVYKENILKDKIITNFVKL